MVIGCGRFVELLSAPFPAVGLLSLPEADGRFGFVVGLVFGRDDGLVVADGRVGPFALFEVAVLLGEDGRDGVVLGRVGVELGRDPAVLGRDGV
jgi:hypothetical protein